LNNLIYATGIPDNIFEYRLKEYDNMMCIKDMLTDLGYEIVNIDYMTSDPTNPSYYYEWILKSPTGNKEKLYVPDIDKTVSFISSGIRWIPLFQIADPVLFKKKNNIFVHNTYITLMLDLEFKYFNIGDSSIPVLLLLLDTERNIDMLMNRLNITEWNIVDEPILENINIPFKENLCISININSCNDKVKRLLKPFSNMMSKQYLTFKTKVFKAKNQNHISYL